MSSVASNLGSQVDIYIPRTQAEREEWVGTVDQAQATFVHNHGGQPGLEEAVAMIGFDAMRALATVHQEDRRLQMQRRIGRRSTNI